MAARSNWLCVLCKKPGVEIDHIQPTEAGGSDRSENLQLLCSECHATKTARENAARTREFKRGGGVPK